MPSGNANRVRKQRIFLRIPVKLPLTVYAGERPFKTLTNDISSTGLSFNMPQERKVSEVIGLELRLRSYLPPIKITLEVRNRAEVKGVQRIGGRFLKISKENETRITKYVQRFMEFSWPVRLLAAASVLLFMDSLIRIFLFLAVVYFVKINPLPGASPDFSYWYMPILILYSGASFAGSIFIDRITDKKFIRGFVCVTAAFLFVLTRNVLYAVSHFWEPLPPVIDFYLSFQLLLIIVSALAIAIFAHSIKSVNYIAGAIASHRKRFQ